MRRKYLWLVVALAVAGSTVWLGAQTRTQSAAPTQSKGGKLALVGGMLIDGYEVPPLHHAAIIVDGDKIVDVGPASQVKIPPDATVIDTSGRTMMPGLIDEHAHLTILGHGEYNRWYPWVVKNGYMEKVMEISAKQLLMAGVTTAVDLGAPLKESLAVRDRVNRGEVPGPHLMVSGPWVTR
jgi:imidazolonepropionase-like amidohydrolase